MVLFYGLCKKVIMKLDHFVKQCAHHTASFQEDEYGIVRQPLHDPQLRVGIWKSRLILMAAAHLLISLFCGTISKPSAAATRRYWSSQLRHTILPQGSMTPVYPQSWPMTTPSYDVATAHEHHPCCILLPMIPASLN